MLPTQLRNRLRGLALAAGSAVLPTRRAKLHEAARLIAPFESGHSLLRVGDETDGGYLIPDDLIGIAALFSPGVSTTWDFERSMAEEHAMPSYMMDASVDAPAGLTSKQTFDKKWLAAKSSRDAWSLRDWVCRYSPNVEDDLMLQMDIEGAEYQVLVAADDSTLKRFRIVVVEYHGLQWLTVDPVARFRLLPALRKMDRLFQVVHVHPNNCAETIQIHGVEVPPVLEVTYLRKDKVLADERTPAALPHPLDRDCVPGRAPVVLATGWPGLG